MHAVADIPTSERIATPPPTSSPLRIAFIVPEDRRTGTYFRFHNLAIALRHLGHEVHVYSQTNENHLRTTHAERDGVPYHFCPTVGGNRLVISPVNPGNIARRLVAGVAPADVYHLFQPYPSGALPWLALLARRDGVFAYDWDDYWMNDEFGLKHPKGLNRRVTALWVRFLEAYLPGRCDLLTTLSHNIAALAHRLLCVRSEIVYNGVWREPTIDRCEARDRLGLVRDATYAGMMGWSGEADWAMDGLDACLDRFPRLRLAWCGKDCSELVRRYPRAVGRVDVLGYLDEERLAAFKAAVDLGLIPMADTAFNQYRLPFKLTDFLAAGTRVLASDVGETAIVGRDLPGVLLCRPDRAGWIEAFGSTIGDASRAEIVPRVDRERLLQSFEWTRIAVRLADAYASVRARLASAA
jgi:glycosyltransferase involved in cell wall biosynthesis